ncbi:hypothetical protein [Parasitella parasitica]|uniref:Uncharacterized protein n=1 Tax=Parasitella parasitica TaxID=35722 RepID=A0A0B7NL51_9FUNG|nr:hypothetical protein [Parasitella parasitica]
MLEKSSSAKDTANDFPKSDDITEDYSTLKLTLNAIRDENTALKQDNLQITETINQLRQTVDELQKSLAVAQRDLAAYDERHATILSELNGLKESIMDSNRGLQPPMLSSYLVVTDKDNAAATASSQRSIPAPSKVLLDENKKKDNRLVELRRITKEYMNVSDEEAGLRLYKLQKTMIHVVSDLKKYMVTKREDINKSWKSIDISTQRVAFEMVEKEACSLGVPLNMCIGYWGARRLISKSWANALRTSKKHVGTGPETGEQQQQQEHDDQFPASNATVASPDTDNNNTHSTNPNTNDDVSSTSTDDRPAKRLKLGAQ